MNRDNNLIEAPEFLEFINREFNAISVHASIEELAEFAFGGIEVAIRAYEKEFGIKNEAV